MMDFVVLNGSPKSDKSVTLHYVKYLEKKFSQHDFTTYHIGKKIKSILNNEEKFDSILEDVKEADGVIWSVPVYTCLVPSQLMYFIDRVFEEDRKDSFEGKHSTTITTSAHFYDHSAHNYLKAISEDLGMNYMDGYSAEMYDLTEEDKRESLLKLAERFFHYIKQGVETKKEFLSYDEDTSPYEPKDVEKEKSRDDYKILLLTDCTDEDENLKRMINVFVKSTKYRVDVQNLHDIEMKGGCLGCVKCATTSSCVYEDEHEEFYRKRFETADGYIFASKINNRALTSIWKEFYDRGFYNGHRPITKGKQVGYLISGPLKKNPNIKQVIKGRSEMGMTHLNGIVTDEPEDSSKITAHIQQLAKDFDWGLEEDFSRPYTFLREGGHKIFRDLVYEMKFVFTEDHKYYKKHGLYDFPQKKYGTRIQNFFLRLLFTIPGIKEKAQERMGDYMVRPLEEAIEEN